MIGVGAHRLPAGSPPRPGDRLRRGLRAVALRLGASLAIGVVAAGCVPMQGGWDVSRLSDRSAVQGPLPGGERLGDMTPFPAWVAGRLELVACRWPSGGGTSEETLVVRGRVDAMQEPWLDAAITAVDRSVDAVQLLRLPGDARTRPLPVATIGIEAVARGASQGPVGAADTLVSCDVGSVGDGSGRVRGELVRAQIRIRSSSTDVVGKTRSLQADEWVGALMHEIGHALGFQGHVARGRSILVRERHALRMTGRRALEGRPIDVGPLRALYALEPGRPLGTRPLTDRSRRWLQDVERRLGDLEQRGVAIEGPHASVGDRDAFLEWRAGDRRVRILLPQWSHRLREGMPIVAWPDRSTLAWLTDPEPIQDPSEAHSSSRGSRLRARATH